MTTTEDIPALLASGEAERRVIYSDEAWYAGVVANSPGQTREWSVGVDPKKDGGTHAEATIAWYQFSGMGGEVWRLEAFGDALGAMVDAGLVDTLARMKGAQPSEVKAALAQSGWADRTERTRVLA